MNGLAVDFAHSDHEKAETQYEKYDGLGAGVKLYEVNGAVRLVKTNGRV